MHYKLLQILMLLAGFAAPNVALACSCEGPRPPEDAARNADAVFAGRVIEIDRSDNHWNTGMRVTLAVSRSWKGSADDRVDVWTDANSGMCGYPFEVGKEYVVYAYTSYDEAEPGASPYWHTNNCTRTRLLRNAGEDIRALDRMFGFDGGRCGGPDNIAALQSMFLVLLGLIVSRPYRRAGDPPRAKKSRNS